MDRSHPQRLALDLELRFDGWQGSQETPHLLLPSRIDRNHIVELRVVRRGARVEYVGPPPPGWIGDVDDLELRPGEVVRRRIDASSWFDWHRGEVHDVTLELKAWSYETRTPPYWRGSIQCETTVRRPEASARRL